jgi:FlaG/FlaF family flagellin (archaellin)
MVMLEAVAVIGLVAVVVLVAVTFAMSRSKQQREPVGSGHWRATHYEAGGVTRVVVQKVSATCVNLLDEHVVAELHRDDADFDTRFLEAMSAARQRQSVFEAEES